MIVLDTCAVIWDALDPSMLTPKARRAIERYEADLVVCDISLWEVAMLIQRKRLLVDYSAAGFINLALKARNLQVQPITPEIAELSTNLGSELRGDPADRLIAATSILGNAPIVTADRELRRASIVDTIW